ncbi:hypothetical protein ACS0TY_004257 [Phlomoides rotata]
MFDCKSGGFYSRILLHPELADMKSLQLSKLPVKSYSSRPFHNSIMGRELCVAEDEIQPDTTIIVATSHLESPYPGPPTWDQMFSKERVVQANEVVKFLEKNQNAIFCGDMNWDDKLDGPFSLLDAWTELRPGEVGWTYGTKSNKMLSGNRALQKRLDRFICKLKDFKIGRIEMIGRDAIPPEEDSEKSRLRSVRLNFRCGHCKKLVPEYEKTAFALSAIDPSVALAKVDASEEQNKGIASDFEVRGFPTLKILRYGGSVVQEYKGPQDADGIVTYLKKQSGPASIEIKSPEDASVIINKDKILVVSSLSLSLYHVW